MAGILHVCTANLIRSPVAEVLTRTHLTGYPIGSAGLRAREGRTIWPDAAYELARRGVPVRFFGMFRSRLLTPDLASRADLILTATREHRDAVLSLSPMTLGRVFTWRELAWLTSGVPSEAVLGSTIPERVAGLCQLAAARRGELVAPAPSELDVADPIEDVDSLLVETVTTIDAALDTILPLVRTGVDLDVSAGWSRAPTPLGTDSPQRSQPNAAWESYRPEVKAFGGAGDSGDHAASVSIRSGSKPPGYRPSAAASCANVRHRGLP